MSKRVISSPLLQSIPKLVHGFSTRSWGDMRSWQKRELLLNQFNLSNAQFVWARQVHGDRVHEIKSTEIGQQINNVDALIFTKNWISQKVVLGIHVADCVPLLFVDPVAQIIAVAHVGWRGTLTHLAVKVVREMVKLGSETSKILVSLGPHIRKSCYAVPAVRAKSFKQEFTAYDVSQSFRGKWYVDLSTANQNDLLAAGIKRDHLEILPNCTYCDEDLFSYRRDTKETFGEMLGFIGYAN